MSDFSTSPPNLLSVFHALPGAYLLLSTELVIEAASDAYLEVTLTQRKNLIGRRLFEAFPDNPEAQGVNNLRASLEEVLVTGKPHEMVRHQYDLPDPENPRQFMERHWRLRNTPVLDDQGHVCRLIHAVENVTETVRAEYLLQESQGREQEARAHAKEREAFYQMFEQAPAAICILLGADHCYEYYNAAYQQLFPDRQLQGQPVAEVVPETMRGGFVALLDRVYQTGETYFGYESQLILDQPGNNPPKEMYFTFTYQAYREKGQIVGISTFAYEVTEQVLLRRQRDAQQQQLRALFEQAPVAIAVLRNPEFVIEVANPLMAALWERTPDQVLGKPLLEALPEVRSKGFRKSLDEVVQTNTPYVAHEVGVLLPRNGRLERLYLNFVYQPLSDVQGQIMSVAAVATDVTEQVVARKQLAQANQELTANIAELDKANQQLTRINVDLDNFIYTASHDLKTPILNIEGLMGALLEQLPPAMLESGPLPRITNLILESVQRFKRTIYHLTEITKLQKENNPEPSPVNLATVLADVQLDLASAIQATQAQIEVALALCPTIRFSEKNLRSILYNLLSNAIKYHAPERVPVVRVTCRVTEEYQILSVQDNGLGINAKDEKKLFGMFKRFHNHVEGSGIGLYMVKKIIDNAGGKIEVQSKVGEGSTFQVYFRLTS